MLHLLVSQSQKHMEDFGPFEATWVHDMSNLDIVLVCGLFAAWMQVDLERCIYSESRIGQVKTNGDSLVRVCQRPACTLDLMAFSDCYHIHLEPVGSLFRTQKMALFFQNRCQISSRGCQICQALQVLGFLDAAALLQRESEEVASSPIDLQAPPPSGVGAPRRLRPHIGDGSKEEALRFAVARAVVRHPSALSAPALAICDRSWSITSPGLGRGATSVFG